MKASYSLTDIEKVDATLTVTMTIGEWRALMRLLPRDYPAWPFSVQICNMIGSADKHFTHIQPDTST